MMETMKSVVATLAFAFGAYTFGLAADYGVLWFGSIIAVGLSNFYILKRMP